MGFMIYDIALLVIFLLIFGIFLYRKRKNVDREGLLFLYRTKWGMKLIDKVGTKYKKSLHFLSYISIGLGYLLMVGVLWLFYTILKIYLLHPEIVDAIKVPPIMPLIPYIDKVVPFLPPFYFTYWIVILAVIAISHEFAHGIFMRRYGIKIKSTGFGFFPFFLPVFPAAFVEQDENSMVKAKRFEQKAVLSAGTFANMITAVVFFAILGIFFVLSFAPAGVVFDDYAYSVVGVSAITMVNGISVENVSYTTLGELVEDAEFNQITANGKNYVGIKGFSQDKTEVALYDDAPAIDAGLNGAITGINGVDIITLDDLSAELEKYHGGDKVSVKTKTEEEKTYEIILQDHPTNSDSSWLGISFSVQSSNGLMNRVFSVISSFKDPHTYYEPKIGEFGWFIYYLLWWLILISISVALVNMLPVGIFDGGKFFYLTILWMTKSEKIAERTFKWVTYLFLLLLLGLMGVWAYALVM